MLSQTDWPMKIGLLTHSVNPRGGVVHTLELATALHMAGHDVTVLAPATPGQHMFRPVPCKLQLVPVAESKAGMVGMVASRMQAFECHIKHLLLHETFDVFHAQDPIGANALANLQQQGLIDGFVRTVHHLDVFDDAQLMAWQERGMRAASQVFCVSNLWRDVLQREHSIEAQLVPNGVDLMHYNAVSNHTDAALKARLGLRGGAEAPVLLAVGGVEQRKNSLRILQAFAHLRAAHPQAQLVIAGGSSLLDHSSYSQAFFSEAARLGLPAQPNTTSGDLLITGALADADMPALFRSADVLLMPSLKEGFGLVVLEALACGTPVVVSNIAPFTEYLSDSDCCWADPEDVASIASATEAALSAEWKQRLKTPPEVCRRFSWTASAARHVDLYRTLLQPAL